VAAAAVLTIVPTIILFSFVQKRLVEGLTAGAIKE
jgi:ABC-type maltose transport system permease subunit